LSRGTASGCLSGVHARTDRFEGVNSGKAYHQFGIFAAQPHRVHRLPAGCASLAGGNSSVCKYGASLRRVSKRRVTGCSVDSAVVEGSVFTLGVLVCVSCTAATSLLRRERPKCVGTTSSCLLRTPVCKTAARQLHVWVVSSGVVTRRSVGSSHQLQ
jgi:hypothetical protein